MNKLTFKTQSGSTYHINFETMWWTRWNPNRPQALRSGAGSIWHISSPTVGKSVSITGPPIAKDYDARLIVTTPVTEVSYEEELTQT